jgi:hypothetical protein
MKQRDYYETPKSSAVMRFLWKAAGGDRYILERATYSDQIKYMCLGGIVFATGAMAALAGGYAFYTIFAPKEKTGELINSAPHIFMAIVFGIIWGLIIFNIDRFIVTSTGKGDGTEKITWDEFKGAIPRIIMGMIIAITISKPIEIRMFQTEIQSKLIEKKQQQEVIYKKNVEGRYQSRLKQLNQDIDKIEVEINSKKDKLDIAHSTAVSKCPNGGINCGIATHRQLWAFEASEKLEWENAKNRYAPILTSLNSERTQTLSDKNAALNDAQKDSQLLDGLLERIKISGEIAGFWITLFITLLFMAIELTPIFFKLMLTKTPYDYLAENRDDLIKAECGIEVRYDYYKDKEGQERHLIINHEAERLIYEKMKITEIQKELTDYAIEKYKAKEKEKIDNNLEEYIQKIAPNNSNNEENKG